MPSRFDDLDNSLILQYIKIPWELRQTNRRFFHLVNEQQKMLIIHNRSMYAIGRLLSKFPNLEHVEIFGAYGFPPWNMFLRNKKLVFVKWSNTPSSYNVTTGDMFSPALHELPCLKVFDISTSNVDGIPLLGLNVDIIPPQVL
jgi:hypothetical protein